jgi:hypothetical protein
VPEWQNSNQRNEYDELGIDFARRPIIDLKDEMYLSSYVDDKEVLSDATVLEIETGSRIAWELQYVYAQFPKGNGQSGEKYLVVEDVGQLLAPSKYVDSSRLGYQKVISGMVTLGDKVEADVDQKKYDVYRAFVDKAIHPVKLGGQLVRGVLPLISLSSEGPRSDIVAQIIGGSLDRRRKVFGKSSIVFLNRGIEDGLNEGQVLAIRANRLLRNEKSRVTDNQRVIGTLKIVKAANGFATAVITESSEDILAGDTTGAGRLLPRLVEEQLRPTETGADVVTEKADADSTAEDEAGDDLEQLLDSEDTGGTEIQEIEGEGDFE